MRRKSTNPRRRLRYQSVAACQARAAQDEGARPQATGHQPPSSVITMRTFPTGESTMEQIVDHCLLNANDINVVVGPLSWRPTDGIVSKYWYFIVCTSEAERGFRCDQVIVPGTGSKLSCRLYSRTCTTKT
jgi:hypothetical protein